MLYTIDNAKQLIKINCREDEINPEMLKLVVGKDFMAETYLLVKDVWNKKCMPKDWNLGIINMKKVTNYRVISLLDIMYKALSISILTLEETWNAVDIIESISATL